MEDKEAVSLVEQCVCVFWVKETTEKGKMFFRAMQQVNTCGSVPVEMPEALVIGHPSSAAWRMKRDGCSRTRDPTHLDNKQLI